MRRLAVLAPIAAAAGALAARRRRRRARATHAPPPHAAAPPAPRAPSAPAPRAPSAPAPAARFLSVPWTIVAAPDDRAELTVRFDCDEHMRLDRLDAQETPTQVFVTVLVRRRPPEGGWFAWSEQREATVALSRPLGRRALVHAPVDLDRPAAGPPDEEPDPQPSGDDADAPPLYP